MNRTPGFAHNDLEAPIAVGFQPPPTLLGLPEHLGAELDREQLAARPVLVSNHAPGSVLATRSLTRVLASAESLPVKTLPWGMALPIMVPMTRKKMENGVAAAEELRGRFGWQPAVQRHTLHGVFFGGRQAVHYRK